MRNPMMEVKRTGQRGPVDVRPPEVTETATKPSPAPLHKYSPGGYTIVMSP